MENIEFVRFNEEDIPKLTEIMKGAFDLDSQMHLLESTGGPDGYDNGEFLRKWGFDKNSTQYKVMLDGNMVGGVILWINPKNNENYLGTIFLDVTVQNKGLGLKVWKLIESMYPDTRVWRTETPGFSIRNHNFYINKCGFYLVHIENPTSYRERSFQLEKRMK